MFLPDIYDMFSYTGCDWILLDSSYLLHRGIHHKPDQREIQSWNTFFSQLGVLMFLAVETKVVTYKESEMVRKVFVPWTTVGEFPSFSI